MKLTIHYGKRPLVAYGRNQCRLLQFAFDHRGWHTYKNDQTTRRAVLGLRRRGLVEVVDDQFRFKGGVPCPETK